MNYQFAELRPNDGHKSFYGKALVYMDASGAQVLRSYHTNVCKVTRDGRFVRLWDGYSVTTMRHVNAFLAFVGLPGRGKAFWDAQEVSE